MSQIQNRLPKLPPPDGYDIGYCKPPTGTRFKPGISGNPKGRPKGKKSKLPTLSEERLKSIILQEAYRKVKVNDGSKQVNMSMAETIVRSAALGAAKGNTRAQKIFLDLLVATEDTNKISFEQYLKTMIDYKIEWDEELARRITRGIIAPDPIPHPDDIIIDYRKGTLEIRGPFSKEEQDELYQILARFEGCKQELIELKSKLDDPEYEAYKKIIESEIHHEKKILEIYTTAINQRASEKCVERLTKARPFKAKAITV